MKKILYTTPILEYPPAGGPYLRVDNSIKALSKIAETHVVSRVTLHNIGGNDGLIHFKKYAKKFLFSPSVRSNNQIKTSPGNNKIKTLLLSIYKYISPLLIYKICKLFFDEHNNNKAAYIDAVYILNYVKKNNIDTIWFGYSNISFELIKEIKKQIEISNLSIKLVADTDSVWSQFILRKIPLTKSKLEKLFINYNGKKKLKEEQLLLEWCNVLTAVSDVDAQQYKQITQHKDKVHLFSNVIDIKLYETVTKKPKNIKEPYIYLAGYFGPQSPTDIAARWIIHSVLPKLKKQLPSISFCILGKGSKYTLSDIKNNDVQIIGQVPDVTPYLQHATVAIVPIKYESGTRFKILEAGACAIPVVSTTLGAEGLAIKNGVDIMIADTPNEFVNAITSIYNNKKLGKKLGSNLKQTITTKYSLLTLSNEGKAILKYLDTHN